MMFGTMQPTWNRMPHTESAKSTYGFCSIPRDST